MDEDGFRQYLRGKKKKPHVIEGLIRQVKQFEAYLAEYHSLSVDAANPETVQAYYGYLQENFKAKARTHIRGLILFYQFSRNTSLANILSALRESAIAQARKDFPLRKFRGVEAKHLRKLAAIGIETAPQMLEAGATPVKRSELEQRTGIPGKVILELVKLSDLSRVGALKSVRARLYYEAGLDTPQKIAQSDPEYLYAFLKDFVASAGFDGSAPFPKEVRSAIASARELKKIVDYGSDQETILNSAPGS